MTDKQKLELIRALIFDYYEYTEGDCSDQRAEGVISAVHVVLRFGDDAET